MTRRACRKDANHDALCDALRRLGFDVIETWQVGQVLPGFPDALALKPGRVVWCEIKGARGRLTLDEAAFRSAHADAEYIILKTVDDCAALAQSKRSV